MMTGFHPIGKLLGEIDWLLDAPDAEYTGLAVNTAGEFHPSAQMIEVNQFPGPAFLECWFIQVKHCALSNRHISERIDTSYRGFRWHM